MPDRWVDVAIPARNESPTIGALIRRLCDDPAVRSVTVVDDASYDATPDIVDRAASRDDRISLIAQPKRRGQLAAWKVAAEAAKSESIVFIDADTVPLRGAVSTLVNALGSSVIASGRTIPMDPVWPATRFGEKAKRRLRLRGLPKEAIIGRFFAVRVRWFLEACKRCDVLANDAYLSLLARRSGFTPVYCDEACVEYRGVSSLKDFARQRIRADRGYDQLREMAELTSSYETPRSAYVRAVLGAASEDVVGALAWIACQCAARVVRNDGEAGFEQGLWEPLATTKHFGNREST